MTAADRPETRCADCDLAAVKHMNLHEAAGHHGNFAHVDADTELALTKLWMQISDLHDEGAKP